MQARPRGSLQAVQTLRRCKAAMVRLAEADAQSLLRLGKLGVGWVLRSMPRLPGATAARDMAMSRVAARALSETILAGGAVTRPIKPRSVWPPRCLTCADRGEKEVAHVSGSGSCLAFRAELQKLRGEMRSSHNSTSGGGRNCKTF